MKKGLSLTEVIVATAIFAVSLPILLNLLPTSFLSLRKAEAMSTATSLAIYQMDTVAFVKSPKAGAPDVQQAFQVGPVNYSVAREFYQVDQTGRWDVVVVCSWGGEPDIQLTTRIFRAP